MDTAVALMRKYREILMKMVITKSDLSGKVFISFHVHLRLFDIKEPRISISAIHRQFMHVLIDKKSARSKELKPQNGSALKMKYVART